MEIDGADRASELVSDLFRGQALGGQAQAFPLPRCQAHMLAGADAGLELRIDRAVEDVADQGDGGQMLAHALAEIALRIDADAGEGGKIAPREMDRYGHAARHPSVLQVADDRGVLGRHDPGDWRTL